MQKRGRPVPLSESFFSTLRVSSSKKVAVLTLSEESYTMLDGSERRNLDIDDPHFKLRNSVLGIREGLEQPAIFYQYGEHNDMDHYLSSKVDVKASVQEIKELSGYKRYQFTVTTVHDTEKIDFSYVTQSPLPIATKERLDFLANMAQVLERFMPSLNQEKLRQHIDAGKCPMRVFSTKRWRYVIVPHVVVDSLLFTNPIWNAPVLCAGPSKNDIVRYTYIKKPQVEIIYPSISVGEYFFGDQYKQFYRNTVVYRHTRVRYRDDDISVNHRLRYPLFRFPNKKGLSENDVLMLAYEDILRERGIEMGVLFQSIFFVDFFGSVTLRVSEH